MEEWNSINVTKNTPVVAGIDYIKKILAKNGIFVPNYEIPPGFERYMGRDYDVITLQEALAKHMSGDSFFIKPWEIHKLFTGFVLDDVYGLRKLHGIPLDTKVIISDVVDIISEYRVFVHNGEVVGCKHYNGNPLVFPDRHIIEESFANIVDYPCAYSLDYGITKAGETIFIEANDGFALGAYGLNSITYSEMIEDRWYEMFTTGK